MIRRCIALIDQPDSTNRPPASRAVPGASAAALLAEVVRRGDDASAEMVGARCGSTITRAVSGLSDRRSSSARLSRPLEWSCSASVCPPSTVRKRARTTAPASPDRPSSARARLRLCARLGHGVGQGMASVLSWASSGFFGRLDCLGQFGFFFSSSAALRPFRAASLSASSSFFSRCAPPRQPPSSLRRRRAAPGRAASVQLDARPGIARALEDAVQAVVVLRRRSDRTCGRGSGRSRSSGRGTSGPGCRSCPRSSGAADNRPRASRTGAHWRCSRWR